MAKNGYSRKGFFGETIHYDANGKSPVRTSGAAMIILMPVARRPAPAVKVSSAA